MDGSGDAYLITFIEKEKKCKRKRGDRRTDEVRASEVGRPRTITSRVVFACSLKRREVKQTTMMRLLLAVVGMATMAGKFVMIVGRDFISLAARIGATNGD